ncbi:hypothetical protein Bca101_090774 [Brassica carinata]
MAANYLNIKDLLDLICQTIADMIKGFSVDENLLPFNEEDIFENVCLVVVKMKSGTMKVAKEEQGQNGVAYGFVIENLVCLTDPSVEMVPFIKSNPKSFNALIFHHKGGNTKPSRKLSIIKEKKSALVLRLIIYGINKRMESNTHENHPIPHPKQGRVSPRNHRLHRHRHWPPPSSTPPPPLATSSSSSLPILSISPSSPSPSCLSAPSSSPRILSTPPVRGSDSSSLRATERAGVLNQKINREKSIAALNRRERDGVNAILSPCHTCLARGGS